MVDFEKTDKNSEFFRITWQETETKYQRYQLGQPFRDSFAGELTVSSINKTSYVESGNRYVRRYTVRVVNKKGEEFDWYSIEDPSNLTLLPNFMQII